MIDETRPLKVPLYPDDVLFFMHIPKTAGLSIIDILDSFYPPEQIFPLHSLGDHRFSDYKLEELARYRLVRGHFTFGPNDDGIYNYLTPKPVILTMLRDPIERTISAYRHLIRQSEIPATVTLEDFLTQGTYRNRVDNRQSYFLIGDVPGNLRRDTAETRFSPEVQLYLAKERLEQIAFFGMTERFRESIQLLTYTLSWKPVEEYPEVNRAPEPFDMSSLSPETMNRLMELNTIDLPLYAYAVELFESRYQQMIRELLEHESRGADMELRSPVSTAPDRPIAVGLDTAQVFFLNMQYTRLGQFLLLLRKARLKLFPRYSRQEKLYYTVYNRLMRRRSNQ